MYRLLARLQNIYIQMASWEILHFNWTGGVVYNGKNSSREVRENNGDVFVLSQRKDILCIRRIHVAAIFIARTPSEKWWPRFTLFNTVSLS